MKLGGKVEKAVAVALATSIVAVLLFVAFEAGYMQGASSAGESVRESVYVEAWGAGYFQGYSEGNATGFQKGYNAGRADGYMEGYAKGLEDGAGRGVTLRDPSYNEVLDFVKRDETEQLRYSPEGYTFLDLAARFKANAMAAGFRCSLSIMVLDSGLGVVNGFNTTDRGMVYVEPWCDRTFTAKPGEYYGSSLVLKIVNVW